jgi:hypothetical protein
MRIPRWPVLVAVLVAATAICGSALGVGPWPGLAQTVRAPTGDLRYTAARAGESTRVRMVRPDGVASSATFAGAWGIPAVTSNGLGGGLSPDGRLLVLSEPPTYEGLRAQSRFLVLSAPALTRVASVDVPGEFGFDAISPDRRTLFLIQHVSSRDLVRYVVRAYDLRAGRLLPGAIVDKREPAEVMRGYPVARAVSPGGTWVYTLYTRTAPGVRPFVHALNAARRSAFCIDLDAWPAGENLWNAHLQLANGNRKLLVKAQGGTTFAAIDTRTLRVG